MRTVVYVDGFNLFYGCVKGTPYKWLDLRALFTRLLPAHDIVAVKYFTAHVEARSDPDQRTRQQAYLRALRTIERCQIILGQFLTHAVWLPRADGGGNVRVLRTEEKGSDVNLATHLLHDSHRGFTDCVVVVSNDSDLAEPLRIVHTELQVRTGLISPTYRKQRHPSRELVRHSDFVKRIREGVLRDSQFPASLQDDLGTVRKPPTW